MVQILLFIMLALFIIVLLMSALFILALWMLVRLIMALLMLPKLLIMALWMLVRLVIALLMLALLYATCVNKNENKDRQKTIFNDNNNARIGWFKSIFVSLSKRCTVTRLAYF